MWVTLAQGRLRQEDQICKASRGYTDLDWGENATPMRKPVGMFSGELGAGDHRVSRMIVLECREDRRM